MPDTSMNARSLYKPAQFFLIAYSIAWVFWFTTAYFSYHGGTGGLLGLLMFLGLCGPLAAALVMFWKSKSPELWDDYKDRLFSLRRINPRMLPFILFLVPAVMIVAIGISVLFGKSPGQFTILLGSSFMTLPGLIGLFVAPAFEEAGWRGYGVDSLRSRSTLFVTSLSFGLLWAFWHTPLFFISGFYHNTLLSSWLYTANFFVSAFVLAFIINWLFYRNNRSIIACFLFHLSANIAMSFIPAEQFTKCIITVLLLIVAGVIVIMNRKLFFEDKWCGDGAPGE
ncbi:CPBP family intramembrane glutamic endopeptidase [Methanoregula sp.]|uniref:CPBP family intramembrane glutamic endopeptidase n=1 Tax=Methanoregula sp. TaxID=2052170 RepID=UPI003563FD38